MTTPLYSLDNMGGVVVSLNWRDMEDQEPEVPEVQEDQEDQDEEVTPNPEPNVPPSDPHVSPLEDDEDARNLDPSDPRRIEVERKRGRPFRDTEV